MKTVEINNIAVQTEDIKPMAFERATPQRSATTPPQPVLNSKCEAVMHYAMLAVIVLSLGCLGLYVQNSINQINSEIQQIYANLVTDGKLGPDL
jgi:cell division protein FtsL